MRDSTTTPRVLFPELFDRPLSATFDVPHASSDGGAVLLAAADQRLHLIPQLAAALEDARTLADRAQTGAATWHEVFSLATRPTMEGRLHATACLQCGGLRQH